MRVFGEQPNQTGHAKLRYGEVTTDLPVAVSTVGTLILGYFFVTNLNIFLFRIAYKLELMVKDHSTR